jgi:hypothetical protein
VGFQQSCPFPSFTFTPRINQIYCENKVTCDVCVCVCVCVCVSDLMSNVCANDFLCSRLCCERQKVRPPSVVVKYVVVDSINVNLRLKLSIRIKADKPGKKMQINFGVTIKPELQTPLNSDHLSTVNTILGSLGLSLFKSLIVFIAI